LATDENAGFKLGGQVAGYILGSSFSRFADRLRRA